jgi:branched-chain amino acid transport system permease protein
VVGLAGLLDLGYVAFYAVGAYSFALLAQNFELGFWSAAARRHPRRAVGHHARLPVLRLRGDYLAIVTLAFGEIIRVVILNWYDFTGGPNGISASQAHLLRHGFSRGEDGVAAFLGIEYNTIHRFIWLYYIILGLALLTNFVTLRLRRLPIGAPGRRCARTRSPAGRSASIRQHQADRFRDRRHVRRLCRLVFATRQGFISPESFTFLESAIILAIVVLGGLGSQIGVRASGHRDDRWHGGAQNLQDVALLQTSLAATSIRCSTGC